MTDPWTVPPHPFDSMTPEERAEFVARCDAYAAETVAFRAEHPELEEDDLAFDRARSLDGDAGTWCLWCPDCHATAASGMTSDEANEAPKSTCPRCHRGVLEAQEE
jgi:hypothetical protein